MFSLRYLRSNLSSSDNSPSKLANPSLRRSTCNHQLLLPHHSPRDLKQCNLLSYEPAIEQFCHHMIDQYDELQQRAKLCDAVLRGKAKSQNISTLGMREAIQQSRKINLEKKDKQAKVIRARKLKIKISEVLNIKIRHSNHLLSQAKFKDLPLGDNRTNHFAKTSIELPKERANTLRTFLSAKQTNRTGRLSLKALPSRRPQQDDGKINLFDNFTDEQLSQIQEDEQYFLMREDMIAAFRRYMHRKRLNTKDFSYERFTLRSNLNQYLKFEERDHFDRKSYISQTLGIEKSSQIERNELHLLTNPLEFVSTLPEMRSKSLTTLRGEKKQLFSIFKSKQAENQERVVQQYHKKILDLKIDRNYYNGLAAEKRASRQEQNHRLLLDRNRADRERSILYRERVKTLRDEVGKQVQLAESLRAELLKRRTLRGKK